MDPMEPCLRVAWPVGLAFDQEMGLRQEGGQGLEHSLVGLGKDGITFHSEGSQNHLLPDDGRSGYEASSVVRWAGV
jgi:hypothetical protein